MRENLDRFLLGLILVVFGGIFCAISLVNHYLFRTTALDLGMFNQALFSFAHLKQNYFTLAPDGNPVNYFGDHFSPITVLYSPFYYLTGSYSLLIIQILSILAGGYAVYLIARMLLNSKYLPLVVATHFFLIWGIYSALSFDFHNNVIAAMMVPWLVLFYFKDKKLLTVLFVILILITKENMAPWLVFIFLALIVRSGLSSWKKYLRFEVPLILFASVYFVIVLGVVMPSVDSLNAPESSQLLRYSSFGHSTTEIAVNLVTHPQDIVTSFYDKDENGDFMLGNKALTHFMVLVSGGISFLLAPYYLIALIPIYLQKFLSNVPVVSGITGQYSIEFVPIISLAFIDFLIKIKRRWPKYLTAMALSVPSLMLLTYAALFMAVYSGKIHAPTSINANFISRNHYTSQRNVSEIYGGLDMIPDNAVLSASSTLAPHLSFRDRIYLFPIVKDAEYIAVLDDPEHYWPMNSATFLAELEKYINSTDYEVIYNNSDLYILKMRAPRN